MSVLGRIKAAWRALTWSMFADLGLVDRTSASGITVTHDKALTVSAYWNGLNVIGGDVGVLDRHIYRRLGDDSRERATTVPAYRIVHDQPNPYAPPQIFWQTLVTHAISSGGGFAEIEWDNALRPIALWLIPPEKIERKVETTIDGRGRKQTVVFFLYDSRQRIEDEDIFYLPGLGWDGICGYSLLTLMRETLGHSIATRNFGAAFFGNGAWPGIALEAQGTLTQPAQDRLRAQVENMHRGSEKAHRLLVLEEGMKVSQPITIKPIDAQALESQLFDIEEFCRWLNLPPHKLKHKTGERPGGNIEASQIDYLQGTLLPWTTRIDQEVNRKLITSSQRGTYYCEHLFEKLLKVDTPTRTAAQKAWVDMGALTPERVAAMENFPAPPDETTEAEANVLKARTDAAGVLIRAGFDPADATAVVGLPPMKHIGLPPVTVQSPGKLSPLPPPPPSEDEPSIPPERAIEALRPLIELRLAQHVKHNCLLVRRAAKEGPAKFGAWVESFPAREALVLADVLAPLVRCALLLRGSHDDPTAQSVAIATLHAGRSREELLSLRTGDLEFAADRLAQRWERDRPAELVAAIEALRGQEKGNAA